MLSHNFTLETSHNIISQFHFRNKPHHHLITSLQKQTTISSHKFTLETSHNIISQFHFRNRPQHQHRLTISLQKQTTKSSHNHFRNRLQHHLTISLQKQTTTSSHNSTLETGHKIISQFHLRSKPKRILYSETKIEKKLVDKLCLSSNLDPLNPKI